MKLPQQVSIIDVFYFYSFNSDVKTIRNWQYTAIDAAPVLDTVTTENIEHTDDTNTIYSSPTQGRKNQIHRNYVMEVEKLDKGRDLSIKATKVQPLIDDRKTIEIESLDELYQAFDRVVAEYGFTEARTPSRGAKLVKSHSIARSVPKKEDEYEIVKYKLPSKEWNQVTGKGKVSFKKVVFQAEGPVSSSKNHILEKKHKQDPTSKIRLIDELQKFHESKKNVSDFMLYSEDSQINREAAGLLEQEIKALRSDFEDLQVFLHRIPYVDKNNKLIPQWKREIMANQSRERYFEAEKLRLVAKYQQN